MFGTVDEILDAISTREGDLETLRQQMEDDFDLYSLLEYEPTDASGKARKGYEAYTSSAPRNFFDKVLDALNRAALTIQIQVPEGASEKERRAASDGELYLFGALAEIDRRLIRRGEPPLREGLSFLLCLRGWVALRALVYTNKAKETVFDVQPWDPLHLTWEIGPEGLLWAAYKGRATKAQIYAEYGLTIEGKDGEVVDFWDEEKNGVIVDRTFAKQLTEHHIGHPPIFIRAVGSMPTILRREQDSTLEYRGDSVWSAARGLYEPFNQYVSSLMDVQRRAVAGSLKLKSAGGAKTIEGDPFAAFTIIPLDSTAGEDIEALELPRAPPETAAILGLIGTDIQQSTLPFPLAYGGTQQAMSGRALSLLSEGTRSVYTPRTGLMAQAYTWLLEELLSQFTVKGIQEKEFRGMRPKGDKREFFTFKASPKTINPNWFVSVTVEPRMPRDEAEEIAMALAATQVRGPGDIPLMSKQTARENILQIRDPDAEEDKALAEKGKALPPILAANIAAALKRRGEDELAEQVMALLGKPPQPAGPPPLPPQLIEAIVGALMASGQRELATALVAALGGQMAPGGGTEPGMMPPGGASPAGPEMPSGPGMSPGGGPGLTMMPPGEIGV